LNLTIEVEIECFGERQARALEATLSPDNNSIPKDQKFSAKRRGASLRFKVESARPSTTLSSIVSLLTDAKLFQEVWMLAL